MLSPPWLFCASDMPAGVAVEGWNTFGWGWVVSGGMNGGLLSRQMLLAAAAAARLLLSIWPESKRSGYLLGIADSQTSGKLPISCCYGRGLWGKWLRARNFAGRPV